MLFLCCSYIRFCRFLQRFQTFSLIISLIRLYFCKTNNFSQNNYFYINLDWLLYIFFFFNIFWIEDSSVGSCSHHDELTLFIRSSFYGSVFTIIITYLASGAKCQTKKLWISFELFSVCLTQLWAWHWIRFSIFSFHSKWLEFSQ